MAGAGPPGGDTAINAPLPAEASVPGERAFRASLGKAVSAVKALVRIGHVIAEGPVEPGPRR